MEARHIKHGTRNLISSFVLVKYSPMRAKRVCAQQRSCSFSRKSKTKTVIRGQPLRSVFARLRVEKHVLLISGPFGGVLIAGIAAGTHSN